MVTEPLFKQKLLKTAKAAQNCKSRAKMFVFAKIPFFFQKLLKTLVMVKIA